MTGRPDTTDPLDRAQQNIALLRDMHRDCDGCTVEDLCEQTEALVAVARAAQGVMSQMDYVTPHHTRLREALARLDGAR